MEEMKGMEGMKKIRIAISGKSGCGNTTVSRLTAERLGLRFINFTFRNLAAERQKSLEEVLKLAAADDFWDREVDRRQVALAAEGGCVIGSRLAIWMLPGADLKVYLKASLETRVGRVLRRDGGDREAVRAFTLGRDRADRERYLRLYRIDNDDYGFADLVIDTDRLLPAEIVSLIAERAMGKG